MNSLIRLQKYSFAHLSRIFFVKSDSQIESASDAFISQDLSQGSKGKYINAIKILSNVQRPITNVAIVFGKNTPAQPGYQKIPQDLNEGSGGQYIYFSYTYEGSYTPIKDIIFAAYDDPKSGTIDGYEVVPGDLNKDAKGKYIYALIKRT